MATRKGYVPYDENDAAVLPETTTPTPEAGIGKVYPKSDNNLYFQDGAGSEHLLSPPTAKNYVYAYDNTTQDVSSATDFQDVTFSTNVQLDGWTHTAGTANFTCTESGLYLVDFNAHPYKSSGGTSNVVIKGIFNGVDVDGALIGRSVTSNDDLGSAATSFLVNATAGQILKFQMTATTTTSGIVATALFGETIPSIKLTIVKIA